ncbi:MAG: hypothetical protein AAFU79_34375 [Myxococcota bacterium]
MGAQPKRHVEPCPTLAHVLSMTKYGGVVAATGLADGMDMKGRAVLLRR